ncbi:hypothetical protein M23134_04905 [Microscilla marina ATCC 23134]|uniref:Uncharacterized protein n=2 Tax=Microscilla marina TaxID=1027 RepID=A1ZV75_MICM2|nr:hypothetical protein M23134_04905 [Microscilla marina ATCC 23134]
MLTPNQQNLKKELEWLEEVIQVQRDFQNNLSSKIINVPSIQFGVIANKDKQSIYPEQGLTLAENKDGQTAWYITLCEQPDTVSFVLEQGHLCAIKEGTLLGKLLEAQKDWVLVDMPCRVIKPNNKVAVYQSQVKGWLPRCFTDIPEGFNPEMNLESLKNLVSQLPQNQAKNIQDYIDTVERNLYWKNFYEVRDITQLPSPQLLPNDSSYAQFVYKNKLSFYDRLLLIMSLTAHIEPDFFESKLGKYYDDLSTNHGLIKGGHYDGVFPSGTTFLFLSGVHNLSTRLAHLRWMKQESVLFTNEVVALSAVAPYEPMWAGGLVIAMDYFMFLVEVDSSEEVFLQLS